ncbi:MAG: hypothetical protein FVQ81_07750 [Candidatus Glassbacteria bacterium]|nr:hypothetical protein [Candidatus Glassbacteria bacterium]
MSQGQKEVKQDWWGGFNLEQGGSGCWRIGPGTFRIERMSHEWRVVYHRGEDPQETALSVEIPSPDGCLAGDDDDVTRIGTGGTQDSITVMPALADKPVVVRPEKPFYLMPGEGVTMYVATPLWFQLYRGKSSTRLYDQPVYLPSLTWFGPSTTEGELCYASRVFGRLEYEEIVYCPNRACTAILLKNESNDSVLIERFNLPVPNLSLFRSEEGNLWTQGVALEIQGGVAESSLKLGASVPEQVGPAGPVADPRRKAGQKILSKALKYLIN